MDIISTLGVIAAIIVIGFISELIFEKFDIPDVLILILIGIIISSGLKWAKGSDLGSGAELFTTFALIFILFQGALSINFKTLIRSLSKTLKLTLTSFFLSVITITVLTLIISKILGEETSILISLLMGTILAGTSSAVVIPLVHSADIKDKYGLVLKLESALSDVLCIIGSITILEILESGTFIAANTFRSVLSSFSLAIIVGVIVGVIWVFFLNKHESLTKAYMVTVAVVIGLYVFVEGPFIQASGAIAALSFGLVLGNSKTLLNYKKKKENSEEKQSLILTSSAKTFYTEISFFVKTFFFVYLGMLIEFTNPWIFAYGALLTLGLYLIRPIAVKLSFRKDKIDSKERTILEVLIPKGLAAAVLAGISVQSGLLNGTGTYFANLVLSVILISIIITSILMFLAEKDIFKGFMPFLYRDEK